MRAVLQKKWKKSYSQLNWVKAKVDLAVLRAVSLRWRGRVPGGSLDLYRLKMGRGCYE